MPDRKKTPEFDEEDVKKIAGVLSALIGNRTVRIALLVATLVTGFLLGLWYLLGYPAKVDEAKEQATQIQEDQEEFGDRLTRLNLRLTKVEDLTDEIHLLQKRQNHLREDQAEFAKALPRLKRFIERTFREALEE